MARALGITQDSVSRLERRSDLLLSILRNTVQAMGGNLSLVAEFPDRAPVVLSGIAEDDPEPKPTGRKNAHAHAAATHCAEVNQTIGIKAARPIAFLIKLDCPILFRFGSGDPLIESRLELSK